MRLHQLYILRSQVDLLIAMEEGEKADGPPACEHPEEKRRSVQNLGDPPAFLCLACGQTAPGAA